MSSEGNLVKLLPAWLELTSRTDVALGLEPSEALGRAETLVADLRSGRTTLEGWTVDPERAEVLHALVALICRDEAADPKAALADVELVFDHVRSLPWPADRFAGPREVLARCALHGWRLARRSATPKEVYRWLRRVCEDRQNSLAAERALATPAADRGRKPDELNLRDPELLLAVCEVLRSRLETAPSNVREDASFFYRLVEESADDTGNADERQYFLGALALLAGTSNRVLFRAEEAMAWLRRSEANFSLVQNANADRARVAYQRLALAAEERRFDEVLQLAPLWAATFSRLEMNDDALKCRFLEGAAHWEAGDTRRAIETYTEILDAANRATNVRLAAQALNNLARAHADLGETEVALSFAQKALPLLQQLGSHVHLVKLRWSMGELFRKQGKLAGALEAYREALADAAELGMRGDVAALHLVVSDLLLEAGQEAQAEWEIRAALPIIDEEKMVPEGIAALSLLRESLRRRQIDKQALRELHGYFQEK